tara:strand:+ start:1254 stop:1361 length:108 start_codon:yes stop_codon:yes gene_type:complete
MSSGFIFIFLGLAAALATGCSPVPSLPEVGDEGLF